ncbi:uncharacterized [Tachysurus ichikawai]
MAGLGLMLTQRSCRAGRFSQRPLLLFPDSLIISSAGANHMLWRSAQAHFLFCQPIGCWKHRDTLENMKVPGSPAVGRRSALSLALCYDSGDGFKRTRAGVLDHFAQPVFPRSQGGVRFTGRAEPNRVEAHRAVLSPYTPYCTSPCVSLFVELFGFTVC